MKYIKSTRELCSVLERIEEADREAAIFLCLYRYDERPDITDPDAELIRLGVSVEFNATAAKEVLRKVCKEQKEKGHPETAVKAMELCLRLENLEKETTGQNTQ